MGKVRNTEAIACILVSKCFNMGIGDLELLEKVGMKVRSSALHELSLKHWEWVLSRANWNAAVIFRRATVLKDAPGVHCESHRDMQLPSENGPFHLFSFQIYLRASHWGALAWDHIERVPGDTYSWLLQAAWSRVLVVLIWLTLFCRGMCLLYLGTYSIMLFLFFGYPNFRKWSCPG